PPPRAATRCTAPLRRSALCPATQRNDFTLAIYRRIAAHRCAPRRPAPHLTSTQRILLWRFTAASFRFAARRTSTRRTSAQLHSTQRLTLAIYRRTATPRIASHRFAAPLCSAHLNSTQRLPIS